MKGNIVAKATTARKTASKSPAKRNQRAKALNSHVEDWDSGLGGRQDRGAHLTHAWWCTTNPFLRGMNLSHMAKTAYDLFHGDWAAQKVVSIPVDDMFREGYDFKYRGIDTDVDRRLEDECDRLDLTRQLIRGKKLERLLGGAVGVIVVRGYDSERPESPLDPSTVDKGDLVEISVIGRNLVSRVEFETDPLKPGYNQPAHYWINGQKIHRSRLLVFDGNPLSAHPERDFFTASGQWDGFGVSVLSTLWNALNRAELAQQGAAHLIQMASVWFAMYKGLRDLKTNRQGNSALEEMRAIMETMSMYKAVILDGEDVDVKNIGANFGGVPEMVIQYLQILSAGSDIPATRFLGQAPGGLNATGESDLENYYDTIRAKQKTEMNPLFRRQLLPLLVNTTFGAGVVDPAEISIEWPGLWNLSDVEKSQMRSTDAATIIALNNSGLLPDNDATTMLVQRDIVAVKPDLEEEDRRLVRAMLAGMPTEGASATDDSRLSNTKTAAISNNLN